MTTSRGLARIVVVGSMIVAGCAEPVQYGWTRPGASVSELRHDVYECTREKATVPQVPGPSGPPPLYPSTGGFASGFQYGQHMAAYQAAADQAAAQQELAERLFAMCMQVRGYRLEQIPRATGTGGTTADTRTAPQQPSATASGPHRGSRGASVSPALQPRVTTVSATRDDGWYLIVPVRAGEMVNDQRPLHEWQRIDTYDGAATCEADRAGRLRAATAEARTATRRLEERRLRGERIPTTLPTPDVDLVVAESESRAALALAWGRCVPADDPRLKP